MWVCSWSVQSRALVGGDNSGMSQLGVVTYVMSTLPGREPSFWALLFIKYELSKTGEIPYKVRMPILPNIYVKASLIHFSNHVLSVSFISSSDLHSNFTSFTGDIRAAGHVCDLWMCVYVYKLVDKQIQYIWSSYQNIFTGLGIQRTYFFVNCFESQLPTVMFITPIVRYMFPANKGLLLGGNTKFRKLPLVYYTLLILIPIHNSPAVPAMSSISKNPAPFDALHLAIGPL